MRRWVWRDGPTVDLRRCMLYRPGASVDGALVSLYRRSSEQWCMFLWWVSTGEATGGQEKADGARVGVPYTWVVHGHTAWNIRDEIPFLRVNDVPLLCLGLPNYGDELSSVLMENRAVGQLGRSLRAPTLCCAGEGGAVR
jgi:hypothetical protein